MSNALTKEHLRQLRNRIEIIPLIADVLDIIYKTHDGRFRFMCPLCHDFDTAVKTDTNLARCFRCKRNFNPIDMVMTVKRYSFMQAVRFLEPILQHVVDRAQHTDTIQDTCPCSLHHQQRRTALHRPVPRTLAPPRHIRHYSSAPPATK